LSEEEEHIPRRPFEQNSAEEDDFIVQGVAHEDDTVFVGNVFDRPMLFTLNRGEMARNPDEDDVDASG
jgi:hypothetical protein